MENYDLRKFLSSGNKKPIVSPTSNPKIEEKKVESSQALAPTPILGKTEDIPQIPKISANGKDEYVAKVLHELVLSSGWIPTKTTPEANYYFYSYIPPAHKRQWSQARVYISKLNLPRMIVVEGLTLPQGIQDRLTIVIRMQKTGGIDRLINSKTLIQALDTNNYFNPGNELVNEEGLNAILCAYLKQAEIL